MQLTSSDQLLSMGKAFFHYFPVKYIFKFGNFSLYNNETPDVICHALEFCKTDPGHAECNLFPMPKVV